MDEIMADPNLRNLCVVLPLLLLSQQLTSFKEQINSVLEAQVEKPSL
jgi:hypothetical protein